jgi:hypothetical protein
MVRPLVYCGIAVIRPNLFASAPASAVSLRSLLQASRERTLSVSASDLDDIGQRS